MKFLVLFVSVALLGAALADVSHLPEADGYAYEKPSEDVQQFSAGTSYTVEASIGETAHEEHAGGVEEQAVIVDNEEHSYVKPIVEAAPAPVASSHSYPEIIYGKPKLEGVLSPVFLPSLPAASGPAYPEEHIESAIPIDSYLPPTTSSHEHSSHDYSSGLHITPPVYSSPSLIEQKLHGEHASSKSFIPSREYLAPEHHEEHHHHHEAQHHQHHEEHHQAHEHHHHHEVEHQHHELQHHHHEAEHHQQYELPHHDDHHHHHHEPEHHQHHELQHHHHEAEHHQHHELQHHHDQHHHEHHHHEAEHHQHHQQPHQHHEDHHHHEQHHQAHQHHEQHHHENHHHDEHQHHHQHVEFHAAPAAPAAHHYHHQHQEYSLPASQTGGYHYANPFRRFRHRS